MFARIRSTKNFVVAHKTGILITIATVSTTAAVLMRTGLKEHDDFLKEHDLYDAFYVQED